MRFDGASGTARTPVHLDVQDPVSMAGLTAHLRHRPELRLLAADEAELAEVVVVSVDRVDDDAVQGLRRLQRGGETRTVLVSAEIDDAGLVAVVECGVVGVVRRSEATADRLVEAIRAAARGEGTVPADLLGRLLDQVGRLQRQVLDPRGLAFTGLAPREVDVLRLVAAGSDTAEIARELAFSERTVKNILHDVTTRLHLRNRSHAVAYAVREGFI
ncbi:helix-turn-helix transcriptional regulator [Yinghuangia seranimata]|uniref:helix-turn-helix transcriptional regulator n=1 Tax=Yinghuangia seranimata TaxID=408067 RepID=UPI00248A96C1|nr:LuxR C-terminal-related transcriptional regulator [Yinghuangia seranimata]MDI2125249.1 LuxR C-terminal-related transcriptional regulator [Yinghuangia seranimata]